jgi:hypothetical protein
MEEKGEGEETSSVVCWDGKKYRYQLLGYALISKGWSEHPPLETSFQLVATNLITRYATRS